MNISLGRLLEGIIATLRTDVIPNVSDSYARGQAVGVIDLLNNIGPRIEWARQPIADAVDEKRNLLREIAELLDLEPDPGSPVATGTMSSAELAAERGRLDAAIGDALMAAHARADEAARTAMNLLVEHMHGELTQDMKLTRKPLFAEIASGRDKNTEKT
jgi:hypothetical protein